MVEKLMTSHNKFEVGDDKDEEDQDEEDQDKGDQDEKD